MSIDTRRTFHQDLAQIHGDLVRLAAMVCDAIPRATDSLLASDLDQARALIDEDAALDHIARDVEDRCYHQLALQQPMASDLRALVTALRLTAELERSGDLVVNISKGTLQMVGQTIDPRTRGLVQAMSDEAARLFGDALTAYAENDEETGAALRGMDDTLDSVHRSFIAQILESCRAGELAIETAVQLALVGRYYERIGDHAVNIGEKVCYLVTGLMPESAPGDQPPGDAPAGDAPAGDQG
jgi:phosphate transport system protein